MEKAGLSTQSAISYQDSVHGRATARGSTKAAVCNDCHDSHNVRPANDPQSGIFKFNVARTCGKCHAAVAGHYGASVHGKALARGNWSAPVCTDCHGIHTIAKAGDQVAGPRSSCARCPEGVRLTKEFGVPGTRVSSWQSSYHGLARRMGSTVAADCASCHGAHDVLPSSDPRSAINARNLPKTCGKCHQGVQANFARGKIHLSDGDTSDTPSRVNTWIRRIYIVLIVLTIGFMALHNLLIWWRKARAARLARGATVVRMNLNQRIQHAVLVVSFTVLVISGFALAWPESIFAWPFGPSEQLRRAVHRIAGAVMILLGIYHLGYMTLTREGRRGLRDFWFRLSDAKDLIAVLRNRRTQAGRFSYAEKAEYWAGLWGTIVMAVTGMVIWYFVEVATWIPRWWIDIATTIHFYEAILATLAIVVWHIYHVIFDPDVYPMNWAWFDGKMPEHHFKEEHPNADEAEEKD
jgi:formate dehydrogenase gamma subunit